MEVGPCDLFSLFRVSFGVPLNPRLGCFFRAILTHLVQPPMAVTPPPPPRVLLPSTQNYLTVKCKRFYEKENYFTFSLSCPFLFSLIYNLPLGTTTMRTLIPVLGYLSTSHFLFCLLPTSKNGIGFRENLLDALLLPHSLSFPPPPHNFIQHSLPHANFIHNLFLYIPPPEFHPWIFSFVLPRK